MDAPPESLVHDPLLVSVLASAAEARRQSLAILDLISTFHSQGSSLDSDEAQQQLSKQQKRLHAHLAHLRGLNRQAVLGVRATKAATGEARQEIDSLHLQLQNLYYEQRHLRGEIAACRNYNHTYEAISLVPREQFLARRPDLELADEHEVTLARIRDEHAQRVALEEQRLGLLKRKEALLKETTAKKEELAKMDAEAENWIAGADGVRKLLEAHERKVGQTSETA